MIDVRPSIALSSASCTNLKKKIEEERNVESIIISKYFRMTTKAHILKKKLKSKKEHFGFALNMIES